MSCSCEHEHEAEADTGIANPAVIDMFGLDEKRGKEERGSVNKS
jgi:hypothetical protein